MKKKRINEKSKTTETEINLEKRENRKSRGGEKQRAERKGR